MSDIVELTEAQIEAMLDRAAKRGARAALEEIGLHDETAGDDIRELRGFMAAWRDTKKTGWQTLVRIGTTAVIGFVSIAIWLHFKDLAAIESIKGASHK